MTSTSVSSGADALEQLRAAAAAGTPFELAILDMQMPGMDGAQLARAIKADAAIAATRLVLLTSLGRPLPGDEMKGAGIEACVLKPVKESRLFASISSVMASAPRPGDTVRLSRSLPRIVPAVPAAPATARILLAEDNVINQKVVLGMLRKLGYAADVAQNGLEVLEALDRQSYDLIFMDCQMPELDGYEATGRIRQRRDASAQIRIVAVTANALLGESEKCLAAGMDDYLSKPVRLDALRATLERWLPAPAKVA